MEGGGPRSTVESMQLPGQRLRTPVLQGTLSAILSSAAPVQKCRGLPHYSQCCLEPTLCKREKKLKQHQDLALTPFKTPPEPDFTKDP